MSEKEIIEDQGGLPKAAVAAIIAVVIIVVAIVVVTGRKKFEPVHAGVEAPDFTLPDVDGGAMTRFADWRGKVVFLNFWATWCKPCEEEMPSMQGLYEYLEGKPFEIVAVSVDNEGPEVVREFVKRFGLTFPVLHDRRGKVKELYKTTGVPETFIIDQNGVIAEKVWGARDWSEKSSLTMILDLVENGPKPKEEYSRKKAE